jgi:hypothetical protein
MYHNAEFFETILGNDAINPTTGAIVFLEELSNSTPSAKALIVQIIKESTNSPGILIDNGSRVTGSTVLGAKTIYARIGCLLACTIRAWSPPAPNKG